MSRLAFAVLVVCVELMGCTFERSAVPPDAIDAPAQIDAAVDAAPVAECPAGYGPVKGIGMYRVVESTAQTWSAAAGDCNDDNKTGGPYRFFTHLVVLSNETERTTITGAGTPISGNTWIGLSDSATEGTFQWVTDEATGGYPMVGAQPPWDNDDPDNAGGNEDCVRFKNTSYVLEDKPCMDTESYVCECDAFPPR